MAAVLRIDAVAEAERAAVHALHAAAFPTDTEARLVDALVADGDAVLSLGAWRGERIVGHVLLSRMRCGFRALGLAPVATVADARRQGIAAALIDRAIDLAREGGWQAIFVLGEPAYYARFGFDPVFAARFDCPYAGEHLMALPLDRAVESASGDVRYARAFDSLD